MTSKTKADAMGAEKERAAKTAMKEYRSVSNYEWQHLSETAINAQKRMSTPEQRRQHIATEAESREWPHLSKDNNKQD